LNVEALLRANERKRPWLSRQASIPLNTIHGWASKGILPRADEALRIAAALRTSVEFLVSGKGPPVHVDMDPELQRICTMLAGLSATELREIVGVVRSYADLHFRSDRSTEAG